MAKIGSFLKLALKWGAILAGFYIVATLFSGLDFESRTGWILFGLAMGIAYVDGSHKDRIADLEFRVRSMERRLFGADQ